MTIEYLLLVEERTAQAGLLVRTPAAPTEAA